MLVERSFIQYSKGTVSMNESNQLREHNELSGNAYTAINKGKVDLVVLRYMAQRVHMTLNLSEVSTAIPLLHVVPERYVRMYLMVFYVLFSGNLRRYTMF